MSSTKKAGPEKTRQSEKKKETRVYTQPEVTAITNKYWDVVCLPLLGFGLLFIGVALIVIGIVENIEDLIILGCLLGAGCVVFFFLMYTAICRPRCQRNMVMSYDLDKLNARPTSGESQASAALTDYGYYNVAYDNTDDVVKRGLPSDKELYGKMRSFMGTPATTKDVTINYETPDTPPPPRVVFPSGVGDKSDSTYNMDFNQMMSSTNKQDVSTLELL